MLASTLPNVCQASLIQDIYENAHQPTVGESPQASIQSEGKGKGKDRGSHQQAADGGNYTDEERAPMEVYVSDPSTSGILDGKPADGKVCNIQARKRGVEGEEEEEEEGEKAGAVTDLSPYPQQDMATRNLFKVTITCDNEVEGDVVLNMNDPVSAPCK